MTVTRANEANPGVVIETFTFVNEAVVASDIAGVTGKATLQLDTLVPDIVAPFPEGRVFFFHANMDLVVTLSSLCIDVDAAGDVGLGTAEADDGATPLATTEQNLIPNNAITFVAAAETIQVGSTATENGVVLDNTAGAMEVWLNFLIDDADQDITVTPCNMILNGTISYAYMKIGDD